MNAITTTIFPAVNIYCPNSCEYADAIALKITMKFPLRNNTDNLLHCFDNSSDFERINLL